jgi:cysteinyl-tRNA synthetase
MSLAIYNTLTRSVQPFKPLDPASVRMYVCGMTTYDYCHLGHGRAFVAFDVIQRWLRASGYTLTYVRNITDIDDKIIKRAAERGVTPRELTEEFIQAMRDDFGDLGIAPPDAEPRATEFVPQMLGLIDLLEKKDLAYQAEGAADGRGDVNFAVRNLPGYGKLSGRSLDELRAGERVAIDRSKRDPLDFVLWKSAKPGEPQWESKWGPGRPGWHIECSAMATELLGKHFDIHGGGPDLVFPHHENELAQSDGALGFGESGDGSRWVETWMHCGALRVGAEKMSKSLDNFWTIRDAVRETDGRYGVDNGKETLRYFLVRSHYRSAINFTPELVEEAHAGLRRLYTALRGFAPATVAVDWSTPYAQRFRAAMDDDFNSAEAVAVLFELAGEVNRTKSAEAALQLRALGGILGLLQREADAFLQGDMTLPLEGQEMHAEQGSVDAQHVRAYVQAQIDARAAAKKAKNFAEADRIRADLLKQGIVLEDSARGTTWRRQ